MHSILYEAKFVVVMLCTFNDVLYKLIACECESLLLYYQTIETQILVSLTSESSQKSRVRNPIDKVS